MIKLCLTCLALVGWASHSSAATFALGTTSIVVGPLGGSNSVVLASTPANSAWVATADAAWLHLANGMSNGIGSTNILFLVDANTNSTRTGTLTIGGQSLLITQAGSNYTQATVGIVTIVSNGLAHPWGITTDSNGNVYFSDSVSNTVKEWKVASNTVSALVTNGLNAPAGLAIDAFSNLYIADSGNNAIKKWVATNGSVVSVLTTGLLGPTGVLLDGTGNLFINQLLNVTELPSLLTNLLSLLTLVNPSSGFARDAAGNLYLSSTFTDTITKWSATTSNTTTLIASGLGSPQGLATDGQGNLYIADSVSNSIKEWVASSNQMVTVMTNMSGPLGVAVDALGNVYATDTGHGSVKSVVNALVDGTPQVINAVGGTFALNSILPAAQSLVGGLLPSVDQSWLTITGVTNGVISYLATVNNTLSNRLAHISVLGISIPVSQSVLPASISLWVGGTILTNGELTPVNFGTAQLGLPGPTMSFTISNGGNQILDLGSFALPDGFILVSNPPLSLLPGNIGAFTLQLDTTQIITNFGYMIFTNSDPSNTIYRVPLIGSVSSGVIELSGDLDFGVVSVGSSATNTLIISNSGNAALIITNLLLPGGFTGSFSNSIPAGTALTASIVFTPTNIGSDFGELEAQGNGIGDHDTVISGFGVSNNFIMTLLTNGPGVVKPNLQNKLLKNGATYTIFASPIPGAVFSNWSGSINTNRNPLTFKMREGMVLQANFVTNPFISVLGSYNGLFSQTNGVAQATAGMFKNFVLAKTGRYSGALMLNGGRYPFAGLMALSRTATVTIKRGVRQGGPVVLSLAITNGTNMVPYITGTVTGSLNGSNWVAPLMADLASNTIPSGRFTMLMPPDPSAGPPTNAPGGDSYALINNVASKTKAVGTSGVRINGQVADGTTFAQTVPVSADGYVPLYASLYANKGLLMGWVNLNQSNTYGVSVTWLHPVRTGQYANAFTNDTYTNEIKISRWTNTPAVVALMTNLVVLNSITDTNAFETVEIHISAKGQVSGTQNVIGYLNTTTGLLNLGVNPYGTPAYLHLRGAMMLNATNGSGWILTNLQAHAFRLSQ